jgi:hypothetical protein
LVCEVLDVDGIPARQRMIAGNGEHPWRAGERRSHHEVRLLQRGPGSHEVDVVLAQPREWIVPGHLYSLDAALGVETLESLDDFDQVRPARRPTEQPEAQCPVENAGGRRGPFEHVRELLIGRAHVAQEPLPSRREPNATASAMHELGAELVLEPAQTLAHSGGR